MKKYGKKRISKKTYFIVSGCSVLCLAASGVSIIGFQRYSTTYHNDMSLAQIGIEHLRTAESLMQAVPKNPFDTQRISQMQHEFVAASAAFV